MVVTRISSKYTLQIPDEFRKALPAGEEVVITVDKQARMVVTPVEKIREALAASFGMWADRTDLPDDALKYVREIRKGIGKPNLCNDWGKICHDNQ
jgi:bifunctional DNA-binding transcriptional regulator/antitoxin component of YhaV-PrlF toxin-antitoxin module